LTITVALSVAAPAEAFFKNDRRLVLFSVRVIRFIGLLQLPTVVIVVSMAARQEVIEDEFGDVLTEPVPGRQVVAKMHARENAALRGLVRSRRDARERACDAR
jgi:hypothetical protein